MKHKNPLKIKIDRHGFGPRANVGYTPNSERIIK